MSYENLRKLPADQFRRACGVKPETFEAMLETLQTAERQKCKSGRPPKVPLADQLQLTLLYHYDYRTQLQLGVESGLSGLGESAVCRLIRRVEERLLADYRFPLPKRSERVQLNRSDTPAVAVDASETPIERPQKKQRHHYSGKNKDHTIKAQLTVDLNTEKILATAFAPGRVHDVVLGKAHLHEVSLFIPCLFDKGYQGIQHEHARAHFSFKASRGRPLTPEQRQVNRLHAAIRMESTLCREWFA